MGQPLLVRLGSLPVELGRLVTPRMLRRDVRDALLVDRSNCET